MKIGIFSTAYYPQKRLNKFKEHGYDAIDFDLTDTDSLLYKGTVEDFEKRILDIKKELDEYDIEVFQVHGPDVFPPRDATEESREIRFNFKAQAIRGAKLLGAKYFITHPVVPWGWNGNPNPEEMWRINKEFFTRLAKVGEENGVVVCLENVPWPALNVSKPEDILKMIEEINSPWFEACLDTGHCTAIGLSASESARLLGSHLKTLHVHDNYGNGDKHWIPYSGITDWKDFSVALDEIGYDGVLNLECSVDYFDLPSDLREKMEMVLAGLAKKLSKKPNGI